MMLQLMHGVSVCGRGVGVRLGVGCTCPSPPVRNNIVTPRHLFSHISLQELAFCVCNTNRNGKECSVMNRTEPQDDVIIDYEDCAVKGKGVFEAVRVSAFYTWMQNRMR